MTDDRKKGGRPRGRTDETSPRKPRPPFKARAAKTGAPRPGGEKRGKPAFGKPAFAKPAFANRDGDKASPRPFRGKPSAKAKPKTPAPARPADPQFESQRIAKVMARAGTCSRRDAEVWIAEGRVMLNGVVLDDPAINVSDGDEILVDGKPLARRARTRLFLFHKPRGLVTTDRDPEGRTTIFDHLRQHWPDGPRVITVGRLDINTEGLLLLTNDGGLARVLELPATGWMRRYRVRANGETDQGVLDKLRAGITIEGVSYAGIEATLDRLQGANAWLTIGLREGKNREIKRVLEHIGLAVNRLIRISFGPFQLGDLGEGAVEEVRPRVLQDQLGPSLAEAAKADFSSPVVEDKIETAAEPQRRPRRDEQRGPKPAPREREREKPSFAPRERPASFKPRDRDAKPPFKSRRDGVDEPVRERLVRPQPGTRKHVSALRVDAVEAQRGDRKRIERAETADRKGRTVAVERVVPAKARDVTEAPATRNGRRFRADQAEKRPPRAGAKPERSFGKGRPDAERPSRPPRAGADRPRSNEARPNKFAAGRGERPVTAGKAKGRPPRGSAPERGGPRKPR